MLWVAAAAALVCVATPTTTQSQWAAAVVVAVVVVVAPRVPRQRPWHTMATDMALLGSTRVTCRRMGKPSCPAGREGCCLPPHGRWMW